MDEKQSRNGVRWKKTHRMLFQGQQRLQDEPRPVGAGSVNVSDEL
jgi:hypothetical protein